MVTKHQLVRVLVERSVAHDEVLLEDLQAIVHGVLNLIEQEHGSEEVLAEAIFDWIAGRTLSGLEGR